MLNAGTTCKENTKSNYLTEQVILNGNTNYTGEVLGSNVDRRTTTTNNTRPKHPSQSLPLLLVVLDYAVAQLGRHWATSRKVAGSVPDVGFEVFIDLILPAALWP